MSMVNFAQIFNWLAIDLQGNFLCCFGSAQYTQHQPLSSYAFKIEPIPCWSHLSWGSSVAMAYSDRSVLNPFSLNSAFAQAASSSNRGG